VSKLQQIFDCVKFLEKKQGEFLRVFHICVMNQNNISLNELFHEQPWILTTEKSSIKITTQKPTVLFVEELDLKDNMQLLQDIILAIQLNQEEYEIIAFSYNQVPDINTLFNSKTSINAVFFGIDPKSSELIFEVNEFQVLNFRSKKIIFSSQLSALKLDKNLKMALWKSLKLMFAK